MRRGDVNFTQGSAMFRQAARPSCHVRALALALASGIAVVGAMWTTAAAAQDVRAQRGRVFVQTHCAQCHAVGRVGASPLAVAPPLRDLHRRYPVEHLAEALAEGLVTGHPSMPEFRLDPGQVADVIGYLKSLE